MKSTILASIFLLAVAGANPVVETIISEAGLYPDSSAWLELHFLPHADQQDLTGWRIVTSTSACTLSCWLYLDDYLIIDSSVVARRDSARGTFRLDPVTDTVVVYRDISPYPFETWVYGPESATLPVPSVEASTSIWNEDGWMCQSISWWSDSTPTPGFRNDDYSRILGRLTLATGETLFGVWVDMHGVAGSACACVWNDSLGYLVNGLAPGRYEVTATAVMENGSRYSDVYPESVEVGYSQTVTGIDFTLPPTGLADASGTDPQRPVPDPTMLRGATGLTFYDALGRLVSEPRGGVYFVRPANGLPARKVVIAR